MLRMLGMIWSFIFGVAVGAFAVFCFYARLFKILTPKIHQLGAQRDQIFWERDAALWERDAALALYKGAKHEG